MPAVSARDTSAELAEARTATHFVRHYPTNYIRGKVDIAYVHENRYWPIEVKWTTRVRPKDLKQVLTYANGRI